MIDLKVPNDRGYLIVPWRAIKIRMHSVCVCFGCFCCCWALVSNLIKMNHGLTDTPVVLQGVFSLFSNSTKNRIRKFPKFISWSSSFVV